jgi:hypothetical protein
VAKKERMTEELKYLTEMLKLLWITTVTLVGTVLNSDNVVFRHGGISLMECLVPWLVIRRER